jgi:hypothetical protein
LKREKSWARKGPPWWLATDLFDDVLTKRMEKSYLGAG